MAAISEPEHTRAPLNTRICSNGVISADRHDGAQCGGREMTSKDGNEMQDFACSGRGGNAISSYGAVAGGGCARNGLGSMPPLEFVQELFARSGELKISLGMTVCDLDADTVMIRPVRPNNVTPRYEDENVGILDGGDVDGNGNGDADEPADAPLDSSVGIDTKAQNAGAPLDPAQRLVEYFHGVIKILNACIHRATDFHLYFVSEHAAVAPSSSPKTSPPFPSLIASLPLYRGYNREPHNFQLSRLSASVLRAQAQMARQHSTY